MDVYMYMILSFLFVSISCVFSFQVGELGKNYGNLVEEIESRQYDPPKSIDYLKEKKILEIGKFFKEQLIRDNARAIADFMESLNSNRRNYDFTTRSGRFDRSVDNNSSSNNWLYNIFQNTKIADIFNSGNKTALDLAAILSGMTSALGWSSDPSTLRDIMSLMQNRDLAQAIPQVLSLLPQDIGLIGKGSNLIDIAKALQGNLSFASAVPKVLSSQLANSTMTMLYMLSTAVSNAPRQCTSDLIQMFGGIASGKDWALTMLDAFGKPPAGLKSYRLQWWGDFDQCQKVETSVLKAQYCKVSVALSGIDMAGFPVSLGEGVCMPSSCPGDTIKALLSPVFITLSKSLPHNLGLFVAKTECHLQDIGLDGKAVAMTIVCVIIVLVLIIGTLFDVYITHHIKGQSKQTNQSPVQLGKLERTLLAFSVYTNGKKLLSAKKSAGSLSAIHGVRFLSLSWVVLGHSMAVNFDIFGNLVKVGPLWISRVSFQAIQNALVSVDTFFTLSGLLVAYLTLKELERLGGISKLNWGMFYFHRFWRLTPVYMLLLGVYTCLYRYAGDGPSYNMYHQPESEGCTEKWWTNLLYINNFVYPDLQPAGCLGHSWYLANDMQFYVLSPLIIVPFFVHHVFGGIMSIVFLGATWGTTAGLAMKYRWPPTSLGGGVDLSNQGKMFDEYYMKPYGRMGPYIMGIITGYILYRRKCQCRMKPFVAVSGWIVSTVVACLVLYGLRDAFNGHPLSVKMSVFYLTVHRTVWGACICWVVFACATGNGGFINTLLSWEAFIPLARLTYCTYLVHPILMEFYTGTLRHPFDLTEISITFLFLAYLVSSMALAFILSLAFESPMMALEKVVFGKDKKKTTKD